MSEPFRLLVIVNVYAPDLGGGVMYADLAEGLVERGMDVTVRCAYPYYPEWRDKTGSNGLGIHRYVKNGVKIERVGIFIPRNPNSLVQRMIYEMSFLMSLLRTLPRSRRFDAVAVYCPLVGGVAFGAVHKLVYRKPLWLNIQDISADAAAAGGIVSGGLLSRTLDFVQRFLFNRADTWCTLSPVMEARLQSMTSRGQTIHLIPNWSHRSLHEQISCRQKQHDHAPEKPIRLLYSGNLGAKQDLLHLCRQLHDSSAEFTFDIRAAGSLFGELEDWVSSTDDPRFSLSGLSSEEELAEGHRRADFVVISEKHGAGGSFVPGKLVPAAVSGTPVLAVSDEDSPLGREVNDHGLGPHFTWSRLPDLVEMLDSIAKNPAEYRSWVRNSLDRARYYDRDRIIDSYRRAILQMSGVRSDEVKLRRP